MKKIPFAWSVHPGEILRMEFMEPPGLSSYQLAKELHIYAPRINDLIRCQRTLTADTAMRLSICFGPSPEYWLSLQNKYDLWLASQNPSLAEIRPREQAADSDPLQSVT